MDPSIINALVGLGIICAGWALPIGALTAFHRIKFGTWFWKDEA